MTQSGDLSGLEYQYPPVRPAHVPSPAVVDVRGERELHRLRAGVIQEMSDGMPLPAATRSVALSPRQHQVMALVAAGLTGGEIAGELEISPRTVRMHCDVLRVKLGVPKRRLIPAAYRAITGEDPLLKSESEGLAPSQDTDGRPVSA